MILGDSITRDLAPSGLSKLAGGRVEVRSTPGAVPSTIRLTDMTNVSKVVLHAGTNCISNGDANLEYAEATDIAR